MLWKLCSSHLLSGKLEVSGDKMSCVSSAQHLTCAGPTFSVLLLVYRYSPVTERKGTMGSPRKDSHKEWAVSTICLAGSLVCVWETLKEDLSPAGSPWLITVVTARSQVPSFLRTSDTGAGSSIVMFMCTAYPQKGWHVPNVVHMNCITFRHLTGQGQVCMSSMTYIVYPIATVKLDIAT